MAWISPPYPSRLLTLCSLVGVLAVFALVWNLGAATGDRLRAEYDLQRAVETNALFELAYTIGQEDMSVFQSLTGEMTNLAPDVASIRTDAAIALTEAQLAAHREGGHDVALMLLAAIHQGLIDRRWDSLAAIKGPEEDRRAALRRWRAFMDAVQVDLDTIQHDLIREAGPPGDRGDRSALRYYTLFAFEKVLANRFEMEKTIEAGTLSPDDLLGLMDSSASLRGASELAKDQFLPENESDSEEQLEAVTSFLLDDYLPTERTLLSAMSNEGGWPIHLEPWRKASRQSFVALTEAEKALSREAMTVLQTELRQSNAAVLSWLSLLCVTVALLYAMVRVALRADPDPMTKRRSGSPDRAAEPNPA
jgi:hypothetical protein